VDGTLAKSALKIGLSMCIGSTCNGDLAPPLGPLLVAFPIQLTGDNGVLFSVPFLCAKCPSIYGVLAKPLGKARITLPNLSCPALAAVVAAPVVVLLALCAYGASRRARSRRLRSPRSLLQQQATIMPAESPTAGLLVHAAPVGVQQALPMGNPVSMAAPVATAAPVAVVMATPVNSVQ
jgi:hypothetical protein